MKTIEQIKEELIEREEQYMIDSIDQYEWLIEHTLEDPDTVIKNFIESYKPTYVHSIVQFGGYESEEAHALIKLLGQEEVHRLVLNNLEIKQDHDIYHSHWNDIGTQDWSEYEVQIDLDEESPEYKQFKAEGEDTTFFGYASLGMIRAKLDAESFEREVSQLHQIQVNELDCEEILEGPKLTLVGGAE